MTTPNRTCAVAGCESAHVARGYCEKHYRKFRKYSDPTADRRRQRLFCAIDGCGARVHGHVMCTKHYLRWRNHGDPRHVRPDNTECRVEYCMNMPRSRSNDLCEMHYYRARRHGDPTILLDRRKAEAGYRAAHGRIQSDRGRASERSCVDCGERAQHWSYMHTDPNERLSPTGQPYSLDTSHYEPRCAPCHAVFDGTGANQYTSA